MNVFKFFLILSFFVLTSFAKASGRQGSFVVVDGGQNFPTVAPFIPLNDLSGLSQTENTKSVCRPSPCQCCCNAALTLMGYVLGGGTSFLAFYFSLQEDASFFCNKTV